MTESGTRTKANMDVEICADMLNTIDNYDCAILGSGDSDLQRPLELLRARGKRFYVMSTQGAVSKELLAVAGRNYIDLRDIDRYVRYSQPLQCYDIRSVDELYPVHTRLG
jgi:uncharacterized LabA/DUF88 family protein